MADFSGHISIKSTRSNASYNSSVLDKKGLHLDSISGLNSVAGTQSYANAIGIFRTENNFAGIVYKGIDKDFDRERFEKFLIEGTTPEITGKGFNNTVTISQKIAKELGLKVKDSIVSIFSRENQQPIYRKFEVVGIYKTDIKMIDDNFVIGDIKHSRKILGMSDNEIGGTDVFLKNINDIDQVFPEIEHYSGIKNFAEKATEKYPQIVDWINIFDNNIAVIIILMVIVVIINIIMVLFILIIERTNSIGILKTLGANNSQIRTIFINYTLLIMIPGLIIGNVVGLTLLGIQKIFGIIQLNPENYYVSTVPVDLNPLVIIGISVGILLIAGLALILPSHYISKISPVKSLKYN